MFELFRTTLCTLVDPCRISIVLALMEQPELACNELPVEVAKATLSHHMVVLREAGLIQTRAEGTKCMNSLREEEFQAAYPGLLDILRNH